MYNQNQEQDYDNKEEYVQEQKPKEERTFYSEEELNGTIISCHSKFLDDYEIIGKTKDGKLIGRPKKIELVNIDLTSSFLSEEMQTYAFGTADHLAKILKLEKILNCDLTEYYNREARTLAYAYSLSKSGGLAVSIAKSHTVKQQNYSVSEENISQSEKKNRKVIPDWFPKTKVKT